MLCIPALPDFASDLCYHIAQYVHILCLRINGSNVPGSKAYMVYISEGMGEFINQETIMKYQRNDGSLFNSPSTTASACTRFLDSGCLRYLQKIVNQSGNGGNYFKTYGQNFIMCINHESLCNILLIWLMPSVPTVYPLDVYARLCIVDALVRTGIDHYFSAEIHNILDTTYR